MTKQFEYLTILTLVFSSLAPHCTEAANILAFLPSSSPSHLIIEMAVVKAMAERQHNITVVSVLPLKSDWLHPNMTHIQLDKGFMDTSFFINVTKLKGLEKFLKITSMMETIASEMAPALRDDKFQELLSNPGNKYDLMIYGYFFADYFFGIAEHFDCPVALVWPNIPVARILNLIGSPLEVSYTVLSLLNTMTGEPFEFWNRLRNVLSVAADWILMGFEERRSRQIYAENFPPDKYASFEKARERVAMVLFSHHFTEKPIRPLVPALIEIGGIHINDQPKGLAKDIDTFMRSAAHGVIFFSMGTNVKEQHMQPQTLQKIYNVLSKLPQKIVWKVDDESKVPGNASNILYRKWLPQSDILSHHKIKLFFGHGGKGGITEAIFHGVPMVGLPIFGDQPMNVAEVVRKGYGLSIDHDKPLTEEIISQTVSEVLLNPFYANNVKKFSSLYRDRPLKAKDNAVYWLEYLLRYKGAPHMQSPLKTMSFVEAMNLDVFAFCALVLFAFVKLIKFIVRLIRRVLEEKKNKMD